MKITLDSLKEVFQCDDIAAAAALNIIRNKVTDDYLQEFDSVRQLYHYNRDYARLLVLNELLECYGVEALGEQPEFSASYLNVGDPYKATLMFFDDSERFKLACWGDVVEACE